MTRLHYRCWLMENYTFNSPILQLEGLKVTEELMENYTFNSPILQLEGLKVTEESVYPVFFFFLFSYLFIMVANVSILVVIFMDKNLHQPMYLLFCNLSVSDIISSTRVLPRVFTDMLRPPSERSIGSMVLTYTKITVVCLTSKNKSLNRKALQTCSTHLVVYLIMVMENYTYNSFTLQMEGFKVSKDSIDIIGSTNILPRLLSDILRPPSERFISYYECVVQAFTTQFFSTTSHTLLMVMAFDRYVAICNPLRYASIMSKKMLIKLLVSAWGVAFVLVGILLSLTIRLNRCRTLIKNPFCDNASLFKLSCESVLINNIYGLTFTVVLITSSIGSMVLTYTKVTVVCLTSKNKLMENYTFNSPILQLEGLKVTEDGNFMDKNLHQPMYLLFCNLSVSDIAGSTRILPRVLTDMLRPPSERLITYYECVVQAFTSHLIGTTAHTILMIMAFDRYVAICNPLRYASIMTYKMVIKLTVSAWGVAFVLVGILLGLTIRLSRCRTLIKNPYCDNASLFKLSCESVFINNVYGLTFTVVLFTASIGSMVLTYAKITATRQIPVQLDPAGPHPPVPTPAQLQLPVAQLPMDMLFQHQGSQQIYPCLSNENPGEPCTFLQGCSLHQQASPQSTSSIPGCTTGASSRGGGQSSRGGRGDGHTHLLHSPAQMCLSPWSPVSSLMPSSPKIPASYLESGLLRLPSPVSRGLESWLTSPLQTLFRQSTSVPNLQLMENYTFNSPILQLEGLKVTEESVYTAFFFLLFSYLFIMVANVSILVVIFMDKNLHQPMYLLFCNLSVSDIAGSTRILPRVLTDMLRPPSERLITYYECVVQAFTSHLIGTTAHTILMIMAFDRYVAICNPLRYASIMTYKMVIKLTVSAWGVAFVLGYRGIGVGTTAGSGAVVGGGSAGVESWLAVVSTIPLSCATLVANCYKLLMENYTYNSFTLQMEGFKVSKDSIDIIGSTNILPRLLSDILRPPSERFISYYECVVQAFTTQFFATTSHTLLMVMAFDRYVAICNPLRYASIMTKKMLIKLLVSAWGVAFVLVGILLGLTIRLNRCRTLIKNPFCDNPSLFKLSCESVLINNIYGLTFTVVLITSSIGSMVLTYAKITMVCLT
ncbi:hypothetical protein INR49_030048, partial [Caranx melampygus]